MSWHHISLGFNRNFMVTFVLDSAFQYKSNSMLNVAFSEKTCPQSSLLSEHILLNLRGPSRDECLSALSPGGIASGENYSHLFESKRLILCLYMQETCFIPSQLHFYVLFLEYLIQYYCDLHSVFTSGFCSKK